MEEKEQKNEVPASDTGRKKDEKPKKELTPQQLQQRKNCVDQSGGSAADTDRTSGRIAATSVACMEICERLDLDLVGVPTTSLTTIPER